MTEQDRENILAANKAMADKALRVLACAERVWSNTTPDYEPDTLEQAEQVRAECCKGLRISGC